MLNSTFTFNGQSSDAYDLIIKSNRIRKIPKRRITQYNIPGRSGAIIDPRHEWDNVEISYEVKINNGRSSAHPNRTLSDNARLIAQWLNNPLDNAGYAILTDTFRTGGRYHAFFTGPLDIVSKLEKYGEATITFNCKPQFYTSDGLTYQTIPVNADDTGTDSLALTNPYIYTAKPQIRLVGKSPVPPSMLNPTGRTKTSAIKPTRPDTYYLNNCTLASVTESRIQIQATDTTKACGIQFPVSVLPSTDYTMLYHTVKADSRVLVQYYDAKGFNIGGQVFNGSLTSSVTFKTPEQADFITLLLYLDANQNVNVWSNFQLQQGTSTSTFLAASTDCHAVVAIDNTAIYFKQVFGTLIFDTETYELKNIGGEEYYNMLNLPSEGLELKAGAHTISAYGSMLRSAQIQPRWWIL